MKNYYLLSFLIITSSLVASDTTTQTPPSEPIKKENMHMLDKAMHQVKEAFSRWRICLVSHEGCTAEERALLVEATNLLLERVVQETIYAGASIGEQLTKKGKE